MNGSQVNSGYLIPNKQPTPAVFGFAAMHPQSVTFNDFVTVRAEEMRGGFKKIRRIIGYYHERNVIGLEFIYELSTYIIYLGTGQTVTTSHNPPHDHFMRKMVGAVIGKNVVNHALDIGDGDYIQSIQACFNEKKVIYLMFTTYRGSNAAFGYPRGEYVTISNPGYTFGPAKGGYDRKRLNYIIFPAATIPENVSGSGYNPMTGGSSSINRPLSPSMVRPNSPSMVRSNSPSMIRPHSPSLGGSSVRTITTESTLGGLSVPPPNPPLSSSQVRELDMKLSRLNNSNSSTAELQQQLLYQQQQVGMQLQHQQHQIQMQLEQIQQQQQIEIRTQIQRQQLMRLQELQLERSKQREIILKQQQQLERIRVMHNVDQQQVLKQQKHLDLLLRTQQERERIHQIQMGQMKALQMRQAQQLEMIKTQQIKVHDGGVDILKRQLEEQQQLEKKHKVEMMRQLELQLSQQKNLELKQSAVKPSGDITISTSTTSALRSSNAQSTLTTSMVRPVSPNTLAPPGQVPIPQVINHPELLKPLTPNQQAWNQQKPPSPQNQSGWNPQNQLGWNSQNLPTPNMQSGSNQSPSLYQQPQFNQQNWQNQPPYNQPPNQSSYNQPPYNNNIPPYNLISNQPNFQGGNLNPQQNWGQQPTPNWGEAQNSGGLLPPGFTQVYEPIDRSRSNNKYEKKPSIPYKDSLI